MRKNISLNYLRDYGLTYPQFLKLNKKVKIVINLKYPKYEKFYIYSPEDRRKKINEVLKREYDSLVKILPNKDLKKNVFKKGIISVEAELLSSCVKLLENRKFIESIRIEKIDGLKKKKKKEKREKLWYAVRANFSIQIEGFKGGLHQYEDRIIIVKAYDHEDAEKVAEKEFKEYCGEPYLNTDLRMVRWQYEKITDVFELLSVYKDKFEHSGTEVYAKFRMRKLKPEFEWHPIKKYKNVK